MATSLADAERAAYGMWVLEPRAQPPTPSGDADPIGMCALRVSSQPAVAPVEVVYSLDPGWWGRGLATRAAAAVLGYALGPVGLPAVAGAVDEGNHRSAAVLRRLGMAPVAGADTRGPLGTIHWFVRAAGPGSAGRATAREMPDGDGVRGRSPRRRLKRRGRIVVGPRLSVGRGGASVR